MSDDINYKGYTIRIELDTDVQDPRQTCDWAGTMVCWHKRYNLGDEHDFKGGYDEEEGEYFTGAEQFLKWWKENGGNGVILPIYLYEHGGITISTGSFSDSWDSGQVGWIFCTEKTIATEWGAYPQPEKTPTQRAEAYLEEEVKIYDKYLTGEVYCWFVEDENCGSYYSREDALDEAKACVDHMITRERKNKQAKLKTFIKHRVPLEKRIFV